MANAKFIGVYATTRNPGARGQPSGPSVSRKRYWFVWDDGWGRFRAQLLDAGFQPLDDPRVINPKEFTALFVHQPHILVTPVRQLEVAQPEETPESTPRQDEFTSPRSRSETRFDALGGVLEKEMEVAAELDSQLRIEFALALTRLRRGDRTQSLKTFESLLEVEEGIVPAHKHMFTDFAMDLRKSQLPELARDHYKRALALAPEDCNAHFNLARSYHETGEYANALKELEEALVLNPDFQEALRFKDYIEKISPQQKKSSSSATSRLQAPLSFKIGG